MSECSRAKGSTSMSINNKGPLWLVAMILVLTTDRVYSQNLCKESVDAALSSTAPRNMEIVVGRERCAPLGVRLVAGRLHERH